MPKAPLEGTVAIVTGASAGIGVAVARSLAGMGARIVLAARRVDRLDALAAELEAEAIAVACDVADEAQVDRLVARAIERFGRVDLLVNNAGLGSFANVVDTDPVAWRRMLDVNVTGTFLCSRAVLPGMVDTDFNGGKPEDRLDWVLRPEDVADAVVFLATRPAHVVVDELVVHPVRQAY